MTYRIVHTYIATVQHHGILVHGRHHTMTGAFKDAIERYADNRKRSDERIACITALANLAMSAKRGMRDWLATTARDGRSFAKIERI